MAQQIVDLRSDTVTRPTSAMRATMAEAEVGDDCYGEDPNVNALEGEVAALFGHEAAMFTPSGSMANQVALATLVPRGDELLCDADAHLITYETGTAAAYSGISSRIWPASGGYIDVDLVARMIRPGTYQAVPTRALAVEQTHNLAGGAVIPLETLRDLRRVADAAGIAMHCDGARIWHAHIADGVALAEYGALFDTMSVCLSKGLGAPVGSLMISTEERIEQARVIRKRMGGAMRQAGILAAAGRYALAHHVQRLADDHARARRLAGALEEFGIADPAQVRTNIVRLDLSKSHLTVPGLDAAARERGVHVSVLGPHVGRLVTHLDVDDAGIDRAIEVLTAILRA
ncbi:threonine aldolase family protein [Actinomadura scrupuli]|uniref:threonine aldolase family protein n=1 Tax=Actinomadura scrupuli TaxID=559629 RepID=UPI003D96D12C